MLHVLLLVALIAFDTSITGVMASITSIFSGFFTVVTGILLPSSGSINALGALAWFGLGIGGVGVVVRFIKSLL